MRKLRQVNPMEKHNMLTVIKEVDKVDGKRAFLCQCDCGTEKIIKIVDLVHNKTKSCGCIGRKKILERVMTHGLTYHRLYRYWRAMMARCNNPKEPEYKRYGARGITVCDEWEDIENFIKDMDESFKPGLTLDRIDNNKGYSKYNCKWSTPLEQGNNKRNNVKVMYNGKEYNLSELCRKLNIPRSTLDYRIKHNKPLV